MTDQAIRRYELDAAAARFLVHLANVLSDIRRALL
jgi:hypothetical protein